MARLSSSTATGSGVSAGIRDRYPVRIEHLDACRAMFGLDAQTDVAGSPVSPGRVPLILDVDTGIDDALALLYACASAGCRARRA